jgi:hypothetical protein
MTPKRVKPGRFGIEHDLAHSGSLKRIHTGVIPAEAEGREPEPITTGLGLWIPGSPLRGAPE